MHSFRSPDGPGAETFHEIRERIHSAAGEKVKLSKWDPDETLGHEKGETCDKKTSATIERLDELQYLLYAEKKHALLVVLQAMDAGGKDGTIRHVMRGLNPQGCVVTSFKQPSAEEAAHDFLWRVHEAVPGRGDVGIFNRSHYEEVLIVRVHDLDSQVSLVLRATIRSMSSKGF